MARSVVLFSLLCLLLAGCGSLEAISVTSTQSSPSPSGVTLLETSSDTIRLSWTPSQGDVAAYRIYRDGKLVGTNQRQATVPAATTYTDTGLTPLTSYNYKIVTVTTLGLESGNPATFGAATLPAGSNSGYPPDGLVVSQSTTTSITITWGAANSESGGPLTYKVYRNGSYIGSTSVASGAEGSFTDTHLTPATTYSYTVTQANESAQSIQVTATTQGSTVSTQSAVSTLAGTASLRGGYADAVGQAAAFASPYGMASDGTNLYVSDSANNTIRAINIATRQVTTLAGTPGVAGFADGVGSAATFSAPRGLAIDGTTLYVADSANNTIRRIDLTTRAVTTMAGKAGYRGYRNGVGAEALFYQPRGIATDGVYVYVCDTYNNTIRKIAINSGAVSTLAGYPGGHAANDGIGAGASFYYPYGITVSGGNAYVSDTANYTVRKIALASAEVSTVAGMVGGQGSSDGNGTNATFCYPDGLASDGTHLYLSDTSNNTIRMIDIASQDVSTLAGQAGIHGAADGSGTAARLYYPRGMVVVGRKLYVADTNNNTVRSISLDQLQ